MRIYVTNTAKALIVTLADDEDLDASNVPVLFTCYEEARYDGPVRFGPRTITDKVFTPASGDTPGYTVCTMPFEDADVAEPGSLVLNVRVEWIEGPQDIRPLRWVKIRT